VVAVQRSAAEPEVALARHLEAELSAETVGCRVGDGREGVDALESRLGPGPPDQELERPRGDAAPLERGQDHPADLMDRRTAPLGVPDPDRPGGRTAGLGHDLEVPILLLGPAAVDVGEVGAINGPAEMTHHVRIALEGLGQREIPLVVRDQVHAPHVSYASPDRWFCLRWATVSQMANDPFKAIAHPIRRGIVERLGAGEATVGEATNGFGVSKPTISKHLRVLEDSGIVVRTIEGRTHRLALDLDSLGETIAWVDRQRAIWGRMLDVVEEHAQEQSR
jgi:DNA-binding transcriptional ArsR family regulator